MFKQLLTTFACVALSGCATQSDGSPNWDSDAYGGVDKSYDTNLLQMRQVIAPTFATLSFYDEKSGRTMAYKLFVPENYDINKSYPLVMFMADASTTGKGVDAPLLQGYGGIIWATEQEQKKHPSFVLVPSFSGPQNVTNDNWQVTEELGVALRLLNTIKTSYNIDQDRIYTTGQSMGGMISFYLNAHYPELFAASLYVGSQWDVNVLSPLAKQKFTYVVSAGDQKASKGMAELAQLLKSKNVSFAQTEFSARLPNQEQNELASKLLAQGNTINFIQFTKNTVMPEGEDGPGGEHMYSFDYAYQLESVRDWLFAQSKGVTSKKLSRVKYSSFEQALTAAQSGDANAQYRVGKAYLIGDHVSQNTQQALFWLNSAQVQKNDSAALDLGILYYEGKHVVQNYTKAKHYFENAWQYGHFKAPRYLGMMYENGLGVEASREKAMVLYKQAAMAGDITAAALIGHLYEQGLGVEQSYSHALQWYLKAAPSPESAAENVHPRILALLRLGNMYEYGLGVEKDLHQALSWYKVAALDNNASAQQSVKRLEDKLSQTA